jgi:3-isopropylmalate/(R)-2-methylmalate dehydratase large subunit
MAKPRTLYDKIWESHVVDELDDGVYLLYIDRQLLHEVLSPQAFEGLRMEGRTVRRTAATLAVADHNVPTSDRHLGIKDPESRLQVETLIQNCHDFNVPVFDMLDPRQGIVHVIGPEQGVTQPGMTIVCGDSHTATHGAFGALAFGIGTSEVEHVLATQTLPQDKPKSMAITVDGPLPAGVTAKDIILGIIARIGTAGGTGHVIEYRGSTVRSMSMDQRMTMCNMSIEAGARAGMVAPDDTTFEYLSNRPLAPKAGNWDAAVARWRALPSDDGARFDKAVTIDVGKLAPMVTYGTNPGMVVAIDAAVPQASSPALAKALEYMRLPAGKPIAGNSVDVVFIGSCTNGRLSDIEQAASILRGRKVAPTVRLLVVPGSEGVKREAEAAGLHEVILAAGGEWREPGCSMCIGMNGDTVPSGKLSVSTSNRNFEGRQGSGARTILASPLTAAASAVTGVVTDPRTLA